MISSDVTMLFIGQCVDLTKNPYLKSIQSLPTSVYNELMTDLAKNATTTIDGKQIHISFDMERFERRAEGAVKRDIIADEIGLLLQYGASKNVITEVTGIHQNKIAARRASMTESLPTSGRPRKLDKYEQDFVVDVYKRTRGSKACRLIRTHVSTTFPINDVWLVVRNIKPEWSSEEKVENKKCTNVQSK